MSREDQKGNRVFLLLKGDSMEGLCILWWSLTNFQNEKIKLIIIFILSPNGNLLPALTQSIDRTLERHPKRAKSAKYKTEKMMSTSDDFENGVLELINLHQIKKLAVTSVFSEKLALADTSCKIWFVWYGKLVFIRDASPITVREEASTSGKLISRTPSKKWYQGKQHSSREMEKIVLQQENEALKLEIDKLKTENQVLKYQSVESMTKLEQKTKEKSDLENILALTMDRLDLLQSNYINRETDKSSSQSVYFQQIERLKNENDRLKKENQLLKSQQEETSIKIEDFDEHKPTFEGMLETAMSRFELNYSKMQEDHDNAIKVIEELKHEIQQLRST